MRDKKVLKESSITIRIPEKDKRRLKIEAEKSCMTLSDYTRQILLEEEGKSNLNYISLAVYCQELLNHIDSKYGIKDKKTERLVSEIWSQL